jgi:plastocyanin
VAALAGCVSKEEPELNYTVTQAPTPPPPHVVFPVPENSTVYVEISGLAFIPPIHNVVNGTTVQWTIKDSATYVITGKGFRSPELKNRDTWNYTFNETGTFEYNCSIHPFMKSGRIIVDSPKLVNNS